MNWGIRLVFSSYPISKLDIVMTTSTGQLFDFLILHLDSFRHKYLAYGE